MLDLLQSNPWRPVDAWWQRAKRLAANPDELRATVRRDSGRGCGCIRYSQRYLEAASAAKTDQQRMQFMAEYPYLYWADWLHQQTDLKHVRARTAIEARILARQSNQEIARAQGCWPRLIGAYEALFFNVRDRLDRQDFILNHVLTPTGHYDLKVLQPEMLWKRVAYHGGPLVLETVMSGCVDAQWAQSPQEVSSFFKNVAIGTLQHKASIAAMSLPTDGSDAVKHVNTFLRYLEIERRGEPIGSAPKSIEENLQEMLTSIPLRAVGIAEAKQMPAYACGAAELRTEELVLAAAGFELPNLDLLQRFQFPDPV